MFVRILSWPHESSTCTHFMRNTNWYFAHKPCWNLAQSMLSRGCGIKWEEFFVRPQIAFIFWRSYELRWRTFVLRSTITSGWNGNAREGKLLKLHLLFISWLCLKCAACNKENALLFIFWVRIFFLLLDTHFCWKYLHSCEVDTHYESFGNKNKYFFTINVFRLWGK